MKKLIYLFKMLVTVSAIFLSSSTKLQAQGNALNFDGVNDGVYFGSTTRFDVSTLTIEAWVKRDVTNNNGFCIASSRNSMQTRFSIHMGNNFIGLWNGLTWSPISYNFETGKYYHIAFAMNTNTAAVYVNGVAVGFTTNGINTSVSNLPFQIGSSYINNPNAEYFNGSIDEVRIYNGVRTANQIASLYNKVITYGVANTIISYYTFDYGSAGGNNTSMPFVSDEAFGPTGTITNFTLTGSTSNFVESYAMAVPTATAATNVTSTGFTANWAAPAVGTVNNYLLDVSTNANFSTMVSGYNGLSVTGTSYAVTGLSTNNTTYYYRVRANKTSVAGQGANSNTITTVTTTLNPPGNALSFNGTNSVVNIALNGTSKFDLPVMTAECWVKRDAINGQNHCLFSSRTFSNTRFSVHIGNNTIGVYNGTTYQTVNTINFVANTWYHIAVVLQATSGVKVYINGSYVGTIAINMGLATNLPFQIGASLPDGSFEAINGNIDEFRIWNTERTAAQILANYNNVISNPSTETNLITYYNFDQGIAGGNNATILTLPDLSVNNPLNAAVTNFVLNGSSSNWVNSNCFLPPTITSFAPLSAKPGDLVTITGTNFNATAANNIVYFGATKANVTAATATSLAVTVPIGATYGPINLLNTGIGLTAYSTANFNPIYQPAKTGITAKDFSISTNLAVGSNVQPLAIAISDLDGDGKSDLIVSNNFGTSISVFRNKSSSGSIDINSFSTKQDFITGSFPVSLAIGDLDGDGKPDLVVANQGSNTVSVFRNTSTNGKIDSNSFAKKQDFITDLAPVSVALGDLDGDGKLDLAIANNSSSKVSILRNIGTNGNINFATKQDFGTGLYPNSIALGDLDGDSKLDIAVVNNTSNTVSVLHNTSISGIINSSSFSVKVDFSTGLNSYPSSIAIGDLDGDGKLDLTVTNTGTNTVSVFRNTSTIGSVSANSFATKQDFATGSVPNSIAISDLDGDGKADLAITNNSANSVSVLRNMCIGGSINFATKQDYSIPTGAGIWSIVIGDLDGDSKPDMVVTNFNLGTVSVLRNADIVLPPTITNFTPKSAKPGDVVTISGTNFNTTAANNVVFLGATKATVTAATVNSITVVVPVGATYAPISVLNTNNNLTAYSLANFNPIYSPAKTSITASDFSPKQNFTSGFRPFSGAMGDMDGDGKPDLVTANYSSNSVSVYHNTSSSGSIVAGSFAAKVDFTAGGGPFSVAIGDVDGDGKPDLVTANYNSNTVSIYRNTSTSGNIGATSFASRQDFQTGTNPYSVAIGDIDGDGKPDLMVANKNANTISVYRNTSTSGNIDSSSFAAKVDFNTAISPYSVAIGDLDGDGKPDMVVTNSGSSNISVYRNTSTSGSIIATSFAPKQDFTTGFVPHSVAIGDIDGDGKADLVVSNNGANTVSVLRNISSSGSIIANSFAARQDFTTGSEPTSVVIGDLDGDGKPDLTIANNNTNSVSILRNTSTNGSIVAGSFAAKVDFIADASPISVTIGDIDGDGKPDLVVANNRSNSVSVLRNADIITSPTITLSGTYTTPGICNSNEKKYGQLSLNAINIADSVVVTAPTGFKISKKDTTGYTNRLVYYPTAGKITDSLVYITVAASLSNPNPATNYLLTDSLLFSSTGAVSKKFAVSVLILSKPTNVRITILGDKPTSFCSGDSVTLVANSVNATRLEWVDSSMNVVGNGFVFSAKLPNVYGLKAYNSYNCSSDAVQTVNVTVNALPTATITQGSRLAFTTCSNTSITLTANAGSGLRYQWQDSLGVIAGETNQNFTATKAGKYQVRVTNSSNCSAISNITNIVALPTATATGSTSVCAGDTVALSANATGFTSPTFAWRKDGTAIPFATSINYKAVATGSYTVAITSGGTTSISCPIQVKVNPLPVVVATSSVMPATVCQGQPLTLSASGAKTYNWYTVWMFAGNGIPIILKSSASTNANFSPTMSGYYYLEGTDSLGCKSTNSVAISVTIKPTNNNVTVQNPANILNTDSVMVLPYSFATSPTTKYNITTGSRAMPGFVAVNNGSITSAATLGTVSIPVPKSAAGTYDFNFYAVDGSSGCPSSAKPFTLTIDNAPVPTITSLAQFSTLEGCSGVASNAKTFRVRGASLKDNINITAPVGFEISLNGFLYDDAIELQQSAGTVSLTVVYVRIKSNATGNPSGNITITSTGATTNNISLSASITTVTTPSITANGATIFCSGSSVLLSSSASSNNQWLKDGISIATATGNSLIVNQSGTYIVQASNGTGCSAISNSIVVTVNSIPPANINSSYGVVLGSNGSVTLSSFGGATYEWFNNNISVSGPNASNTYTVTNVGQYTVKVTNSDGCSATSQPTTITALPQATAAGATKFCQGQSVDLSYIPANTEVFIRWKNENDSTVGTNLTYTATTSGSYRAEVNTGSIQSTQPINIVVNTLPNVSLVSNANPANVCVGTNLTLTASGAQTYTWYANNSNLNITGNTAITPTLDALYKVIGVDSNGCASTSSEIDVKINPIPTFTLSTNPVIAQSGTSFVLPFNNFSNGPDQFSLSAGSKVIAGFTPLNNEFIITTNNITVAPTAADVYDFNVSVRNSATGCVSDVKSFEVTVIGVSSSTSNLSICPSQLPYSWNGLTFNTAGSQTATGLITSAGFDSTATLNLIVKQASSSTTNLSICSNQLPYIWNGLTFTSSGTQTAHLTNAAGCDSVATLNLTIKQATSSSTSIAYCQSALPTIWNGLTISAIGTYIAHLTNAAGCDSAATLVATLKPGAVPNVNYATSDNVTTVSMCSVGSVFQIANYTAPNGTWTSSNTSVVTVTPTGSYNRVANIKAIGVGTATVTYSGIVSTGGCSSSISSVVTVSPQAAPSAITGSATACLNAATVYSSSPAGGVWTGVRGTFTGNVYTPTSTGAGTVTYTLTNAAGCSTSVTKAVTINALPAMPTIGFASGTTGITGTGGYCKNRTFTLVGTPAGGTWSSSDTTRLKINSSGVCNSVGLGVVNAIYTLTVSGCSSSRTAIGNIVTCSPRGINNTSTTNNEQFVIYPNPTHSIISLKVDKLIGAGSIVVTDLYGKQVKQQTLSMGVNTIDVSSFAKGMYLVSVITEQGKQTQKVLVE